MKQIYIKTKKTKIFSTGSIIPVSSEEKCKNLKIENSILRNIFLDQNIGKGPPGRTCSPEAFDRLTWTIISIRLSMNYINKLLIKTNSISHNFKFFNYEKANFIFSDVYTGFICRY